MAKESNIVKVLFLPSWVDRNFILSLVGPERGGTVQRGSDGLEKITIFPPKAGQDTKNCLIFFTGNESAGAFLRQWNRQIPPRCDDKITVEYYEDRRKEDRFDKPIGGRFPSNQPLNNQRGGKIKEEGGGSPHVRVTGVPKWADKEYILSLCEANSLKQNEQGIPFIFIETHRDHNTVFLTFISNEKARNFRNKWHWKAPPRSSYKLVVDYIPEKRIADEAAKAKFEGEPSAKPLRNSTSNSRQSLIQESSILRVSGLPKWFNEVDVKSMEAADGIVPNGIDIYKVKTGQEYAMARITFVSTDKARDFLKRWDWKSPPKSSFKLSIKYWVEEEAPTTGFTEKQNFTSKTVFIDYLPKDCTNEYLLLLAKDYKVACNPLGEPKIWIWDFSRGLGFSRKARITFEDLKNSSDFINEWNGKKPSDQNILLHVRYYLDKEGLNEDSDKPITIVRNVVYVKNLSRVVNEERLFQIIEKETGQKAARIKMYPPPYGKNDVRATAHFKKACEAQICVDKLNKQMIEGMPLDVSLFASSSFRRLPTATQNEHLFSKNAIAYAYDCVACFETFDERDMIGCVPIGKEETDLETHFLCQQCARANCTAIQFNGLLGEGGAGIPCGETGCRRVLLWAPVRRILLDAATKDRLDIRMTKDALRNIEGIEYCIKDCGFGMMIEQGPEMNRYFHCLNEECKTVFCRTCKFTFNEHSGKTCDQMRQTNWTEEQRERHKMEQAEEFLSASKIRTCSSCGYRFTKDNDGSCNKMKCPSCGVTKCYYCRQSNIGYEHYRNQNFERVEGICLLFSDTTLDDDKDYTRAVREAEGNEYLRQGLELLRQKYKIK